MMAIVFLRVSRERYFLLYATNYARFACFVHCFVCILNIMLLDHANDDHMRGLIFGLAADGRRAWINIYCDWCFINLHDNLSSENGNNVSLMYFLTKCAKRNDPSDIYRAFQLMSQHVCNVCSGSAVIHVLQAGQNCWRAPLHS